MARDKNTYAKRQRETIKRQKVQEKNERRRKRKEEPDAAANSRTDDNPAGEPQPELGG